MRGVKTELTMRRILPCRGGSVMISILPAASEVAAGFWSSRIPRSEENPFGSFSIREISACEMTAWNRRPSKVPS